MYISSTHTDTQKTLINKQPNIHTQINTHIKPKHNHKHLISVCKYVLPPNATVSILQFVAKSRTPKQNHYVSFEVPNPNGVNKGPFLIIPGSRIGYRKRECIFFQTPHQRIKCYQQQIYWNRILYFSTRFIGCVSSLRSIYII